MNREDIIRMAREAGWDAHHAEFDTRFQTFAALVIANHPPQSYMSWQEGYEAGKQTEREEIAQFIERTELGSLPDETALQYARLLKSYSSSIRARGQA